MEFQAKKSELDTGNQALLENFLGLEKSIREKMERLDMTDDSLLSKISGLLTENTQSLADTQQDLDNKLEENDKSWQIQHDSNSSESKILKQHLEEVRSLFLATDKRIVKIDVGKQ